MWRCWRCPRTREAAAQDFADNRMGPKLWVVLADTDRWDTDCVIDWKRMIAASYGLSRGCGILCKQEEWSPDWKRRLLDGESHHGIALRDGNWMPGWNRWLLAEAGPEPEIAAERILRRVSDLARLRIATPDRGGDQLAPS